MNALIRYGMIATAILCGFPKFGTAEIAGFSVDVEQALTQAEKENKDLLMNFNGSDWCGWCIRMREEIFSQEEFQNAASEHFVLVELDFPNDDSRMSKETLAQNTHWQEKLAVEGFPAIYLLDQAGKPYALTGYQPGGPERYLEHLTELRQVRVQRDELFALADKVTGVERAKFLDSGLETMGMELALTVYTDQVEEILRLDADNETGLRSKYQEPLIKAAYQRLMPVIYKVASEQGPEAALRRLEKAEKQFPARGKLATRLVAIKAHFLGQSDRLEDALALMDENLETAEVLMDKIRLHYFKANLLATHERTADAALTMDAAIELADDEDIKAQLEDVKQSLLAQAEKSEENTE